MSARARLRGPADGRAFVLCDGPHRCYVQLADAGPDGALLVDLAGVRALVDREGTVHSSAAAHRYALAPVTPARAPSLAAEDG